MEKKKSNWNQATLLTGDGIKYSRKGIYNCQNHIRLQKAKYRNILCVQSSNLHQKWVTGVRHGISSSSSLVEYRKVG